MSVQAFAVHDLAIDDAKTRTKIDFELDLDGFTSVTIVSYAGLLWRSAAAIDGHKAFDEDAPESGYITGITSGRQVVFDGGGKSMGFAADGSFDVKSVQMTADWAQDLTVKIVGYLDGAKVHATSVHITDDAPTLVKLDWMGVVRVELKPSNAVVDPEQPHEGNHFVMDDLVIANLVSSAPVAAPTLAHAFAGGTFAGGGHDALAVAPGHLDLTPTLALA